MRLTVVAVVAVVVSGGLFASRVGYTVTAQQPACLHGPQETADQAARKRAALTFTRQVNTLQLRARAANAAYATSDQLQLSSVPDGFEFRLAVTPAAYAFSVRDNTDPCRFAFFSDEQGLIFSGEVIR
jgi:hypothetical protein